MMSEIQGMVTGEQVAVWIIIAFLVGYFIYKEYPEFKKRITKGALDEQKQEVSEKTILERLDAIENKLKVMDEKLTRDYERINTVEREQKNVRKAQNKSLEERGIIMRALLALMEGSEESEKIRESENEINSYLIKQAHQGEEL